MYPSQTADRASRLVCKILYMADETIVIVSRKVAFFLSYILYISFDLLLDCLNIFITREHNHINRLTKS